MLKRGPYVPDVHHQFAEPKTPKPSSATLANITSEVIGELLMNKERKEASSPAPV